MAQERQEVGQQQRRIENKGIVYWLFGFEAKISGEQDDYDIQQSVGLKDKNGKEIWKGDVLLVFDEAVVPVTDEGRGR
jgi:uncharacterized phage protein (TIGR01671 family)